MRTSSSIESDDEDECLPNSIISNVTNNCVSSIEKCEYQNIEAKNIDVLTKKNCKSNGFVSVNKNRKRKYLGSSSFLIKANGFLKFKDLQNQQDRNKILGDINLYSSLTENQESKENLNKTLLNDDNNLEIHLDKTGKSSEITDRIEIIDEKNEPINHRISDDIVIKKNSLKSLRINKKRDFKDLQQINSLDGQDLIVPTFKKHKLSFSEQHRREISNKVKSFSDFRSIIAQQNNLQNLIHKNLETKEPLNENKQPGISFQSDIELFFQISTKRKLNRYKNLSISPKKKEKSLLKQICTNSTPVLHLNSNNISLTLKNNQQIGGEFEKENKFKPLDVVNGDLENLLGKKSSLSLTKLKRPAINDFFESTRPKKLKENNIINNAKNSTNGTISDSTTMSMYDRRANVFAGMDSIGGGERATTLTNGLLTRLSNDDNPPVTAGSQYSSASASNFMSHQHHQHFLPHQHQPNNFQQSTAIATLSNIGNTCYLNSVVYTLRFAPQFLHNLHHLVEDLSHLSQNIVKYRAKSSSLGRNVPGFQIENARSWSSKDLVSLESNNGVSYGGVNSNIVGTCDNQKSSQQIATEKLHELYQHLHRNEMNDSTEPFHADTFLHAIQDVSAIFEGNQQQDAHEFLMCVLDNIRETCQSLTKAITECPDVISNGYVGMPEQSIENTATKNSSINTTIQKEPVQQQQTTSGNSGSTSNIIKTSFFSRKSKRKDEAKNSKNIRSNKNSSINKENPSTSTINQFSPSTSLDVTSESTTATNNGGVPVLPIDKSIENDIGRKNISNKLNSSPTSNSGSTQQNLNTNKERLVERIKKLGLDFFSQYFEGVTVSTTKCLSCETITEQKETMIDIAVPISGYENIDGSESFIQNSCITREYFRGENKYRCEQCTGYTEAIRSISYEVLPRLLIIQLSRFSGGMEKINSYLPTPFTLQCFCSKCCKASDNEKLHIYKLYSVITHVGATMSVGHYIAYTCLLDWQNEYVNCPRDRRRRQQLQQQQNKLQNLSNNSGGNTNNSQPNLSNGSSSSSSMEKNLGLVKKLIYGRSKASSSGDMTKNMKNLNGITGGNSTTINNIASTNAKDITNGVDKIKIGPTICQGLNCCGIKMRQNNLNYSTTSLNNIGGNGVSSSSATSSHAASATNLNGSYIDLSDDNINNANCGPNYGSMNGRAYHNRQQHHQQQTSEPIWYMCDDDKIKAMTQKEFEELLSPNRKIMITPYLLFYARKNLQENDSSEDFKNSSDE